MTVSHTGKPRSIFIRAVPMSVSQRNPPLQPPVVHEFGPGFTEKLHSVLPHSLPAVQSCGTVNVIVVPDACSQPVGWDGTDFPALRSVYKAGLEDSLVGPSCGHDLWSYQIVKGQWFVTVKVRKDPGPAFPETGLGTGVDGVEVGLSDDDVVVTARAAILPLREQTFMGRVRVSKLCHFESCCLMVGARSTAAKVTLKSPSPGLSLKNPPGWNEGRRKLRKDSSVDVRYSAVILRTRLVGLGRTSSVRQIGTKGFTLPNVTHPIISWYPCPLHS